MYGTQIVKNGKVIRKSKNLRGLRDYARISKVLHVKLTPYGYKKLNGHLKVVYADGAASEAHFASYHIMVDWVRNRRSWYNAHIAYNGENLGYLTKPGVIANS